MTQIQAIRVTAHSDNKGIEGTQETTPIDVRPAWEVCLASIQERLPMQSFQTWILPIIPVSYAHPNLVLRVPSRFFFEWLDSHYGELLRSTIATTLGDDVIIDFLIASSAQDEEVQDAALTDVADDIQLETVAAPVLLKKAKPDYCDQDHAYKLNAFFCNRDNELPIRVAMHSATHWQNPAYSPVVYHGGVGSGKSHVLNGIANQISANAPDAQVLMISADRFLHNYVYAVQTNSVTQFVNELLQADVLLVDNLQLLAGKTKSQETLLFIITELQKRSKLVIMSTNDSPARLQNIHQDLVSFCQKGLIVDLLNYDSETRERIIRSMLAEDEVILDEKIIHYLAENLTANLHDLRSVMVRVIAQISLTNKGVRFEEVQYILSQLCPTAGVENASLPLHSSVTINDIVTRSAEYFNIPVDILQGISRKARIIRARQITIYLCRELTAESLSSIGYHFSNLHHASVLYSYNKIEDDVHSNPMMRNTVSKLRAQICA